MNKILKEDLLQAIETVKPALGKKELIDQADCIVFMNGRVITYNDTISISHPVLFLEVDGAVNADELHKLLSKLKSSEIEVENNDAEVVLKSGRMKVGFRLHHKIVLPLSNVEEVDEWYDLPDNFCKALDFGAQSCSKDVSQPILTCVHITSNYIEGSDSMRVSRHQLNTELPFEDCLIPVHIVGHILRFNPTKICLTGGWLHFKNGDTIFSCRTINDKYPITDRFFQGKGLLLNFPMTLSTIIERVRIFAKTKHYLDEVVQVKIENKRITIMGTSSETGSWFEENANIRYTGMPLEFQITPVLFLSILNQSHVGRINENLIEFTGDDWAYVALLR